MKLYFKIKYNLIRAILYLLILPKKGYGIEIGVWRGFNAKLLYYLSRPVSFDLIDPYISGLCDMVYQPVASQNEMDGMFRKVSNWAIKKCNQKNMVFLHRTTSQMMSYRLTLKRDWIYIDGDHKDCLNDLIAWYPLIRKGGIMMGDDYDNRGYPKVKKDVDRFCKERGIKLHHFYYQWWFKV